MTLAKELAMALNCHGQNPPCHECPACKKIESGNHTDVQVIRLTQSDEGNADSEATKISIEQIKDIQHSASLPPFEGKQRVYIIEGANSYPSKPQPALKNAGGTAGQSYLIPVTVNEKLLLDGSPLHIEFQPIPVRRSRAGEENRYSAGKGAAPGGAVPRLPRREGGSDENFESGISSSIALPAPSRRGAEERFIMASPTHFTKPQSSMISSVYGKTLAG